MRYNKTKVLLTVILLISLGSAVVIGNYFIDFALRRGNAEDAAAPPAACGSILDPTVKLQKKPAFASEKWQLVSAEGLILQATCFTADTDSDKWVLIVHGYGRDQCSVWDIAARYLQAGYNVLTPDLRASGGSEGSYLSMGARESSDLQLWLDQIVQRQPQAQIFMHGVSMGGATVLLTAARPLPDNVRLVIADCSYTSAYTMFALQLRQIFDLPSFPIMNIVDLAGKVKTGAFVSDAAPLQAAPKITIPVLVIHGEADELAPVGMAEELYAAVPGVKALLKIPDAAHADARKSDPRQYYDTIFGFIEQNTY